MRRLVASAYFLKGDDGRALEMAATAAERSRGLVPLADWTAGLAAWRLGQRERARDHFAYLARSRSSSGWNVAAGAFWAARANLVTGRAERVNPLLERAVRHPHTFYGLIAGAPAGARHRLRLDPTAARRSRGPRPAEGAGGAPRRGAAAGRSDPLGRSRARRRARPGRFLAASGAAGARRPARSRASAAGHRAEPRRRRPRRVRQRHVSPARIPRGSNPRHRPRPRLRADPPGIPVQQPGQEPARRPRADAAHAADGRRHGAGPAA